MGSRKQRRTIAQGLFLSDRPWWYSNGITPTGASNTDRLVNMSNFQPISCYFKNLAQYSDSYFGKLISL